MSDNIKLSSFFENQGVILDGAGVPLSRLDKETILSLISSGGFVLFRDFATNMREFTGLVERVSSRLSLDPARTFYSNVAQKVDAGTGPVGLHCENGNSPFWPDVAWFYCEKAAKKGSQTTLCDGRLVWLGLSKESRRLFTNKDITYQRTVGEQQWKDYVYHCRKGQLSMEVIRLEHLQELTSPISNAELQLQPDGSLYYTCTVPAARKTLFSDELSFANSILGPSYNYEKPRITFSDGTDIPEVVMGEIERVTAEKTLNIDWKDGDIVMIDNTRVMHGRRAIEDTDRTIYNALSYL